MRIRGPALLALILLVAPGAADPAAAQDARLGLVGGATAARYQGPATVDFEDRTGPIIGVFAYTTTPISLLAIQVEARWVRRGGSRVGGGGAEVDLLSVPLAFGPEFTAGRLSLFPSAGLEVAYPIAARISSNLEAGFGRTPAAEASGFVGLGIGVDVGRGLRIGVEARRLRGFGASFEGTAGRLESRATEWMVRVSRPSG